MGNRTRSTSRKTSLPVTIAVAPSIRLALYKRAQRAQPILVGTTKRERLHRVVDEYPDVLLTLVASQLFRDHPSRKGRHPRNPECSRQVQSVSSGWLCGTEESNSRIDGDQLVVVREISIEITIEGEGSWG